MEMGLRFSLAMYQKKEYVMEKHIFVLGADEFNLAKLRALPEAGNYVFHKLLTLEECQPADKDPKLITNLLGRAQQQLQSATVPIDAIVGYWDYPVSTLLPVLCAEYGLPAASLQSVMACEHKYWSRLIQHEVVPEQTPAFQSFNPFVECDPASVQLDYPFWLKPIKAHSSQMSYKIRDAHDLCDKLASVRQHIGHFAELFNQLLKQCDVPPEVGPVDGRHCIGEESLTGRQCTIEGFVYQGKAQTYGVIDIILEPGRSSFAHYQYPSTFPQHIQQTMSDVSCAIMSHVGYDNAPFNIEFFYDEERNRLLLLEINTRISQSHSSLFQKVDGTSNFSLMLALALGQCPPDLAGQGTFDCAGKFFLRKYEDALVTSVPGDAEIWRVREHFPEAVVKISAQEGIRLSQLPSQETYSFQLGEVVLGAQSEAELLDKYHQCKEMLPFQFAE